MYVIICDDSSKDREHLCDLCVSYAREQRLQFHIRFFSSGERLLAHADVYSADLIFLDIYMGGLSGIETAGILRSNGYEGALIFTTVTDDFYAAGFDLAVLHYLLKPVTVDNLEIALNRTLRTIAAPERWIEVMSERVTVRVLIRNISHFEVYGHNIFMYTEEKKLKINTALQQLEEALPSPPFLRCYRSYLINMDQVHHVEEQRFVMNNKAAVPITKKLCVQIRSEYMNYILGKKPGTFISGKIFTEHSFARPVPGGNA